MGKGFAGINQVVQQQAESRAAGNRTFFQRFRLQPGESAIVRFLEQDDEVAWAWVCQLPPRGNQRWGDFTPSLDKDRSGSVACPLIEAGLRPAFRGWINLIWRNGPMLKRDSDGRVVRDPGTNKPIVDGAQDMIAVWESGIQVFEMLASANSDYRGLTSRDFKITRIGSGLSTKYTISPADPDGGPKELSTADIALADKKYDLVEFITPKPEAELKALLGQVAQDAAEAEEVDFFRRRR